MSSFFDKMHTRVHDIGSDVKKALSSHIDVHAHTHTSGTCADGLHDCSHRYDSFAPPRAGNDVKWYVDGCSYMWAVSKALEQAQESIWILDWWLSPELYLRRPPSANEQYRVDRMLDAAAKRGVKVNIIVYKEVTQALTLSSAHTKHALEALDPNISVFRHPDHLPDVQTFSTDLRTRLSNLKLSASAASRLNGMETKNIFGTVDDTVLYWAHHEKLCLIDGKTAFMGGLDLCYGRWDTTQHSIADTHPSDVREIVFPGQDYNNARIMDFQEVSNWQDNKLDRTVSSRMGWSDVSLCLHGPVVQDLRAHFAQRWNYIYDQKYHTRVDQRYQPLPLSAVDKFFGGHHLHLHHHGHEAKPSTEDEGLGHKMLGRLNDKINDIHRHGHDGYREEVELDEADGGFVCQITRSCAKWSSGVRVEHSIANAYIDAISNSQHFVYIENQFFISLADPSHRSPVKNQIATAIVERILRAARAGEKYRIIVVMPAVPAFAGDLRSEGSLGTRAIMEFQYFTICRGGHSIMERIKNEGFDPKDYIRFYNLRNYDRINTSSTMLRAEQQSGVSYEDARKEHDDAVGAGFEERGEETGAEHGNTSRMQRYQNEAIRAGDTSRWDSVASCYMLYGEDIRNVPWEDGETTEIDAFVSEELYVHSKLLIADDRVVICGSANLNDRSQLGDHDSEIAVVITTPLTLASRMNDAPFPASPFAASLRRHIFRKHLGLLAPQDPSRPDANFEPLGTPNAYDWGSPEDVAVLDPLSDAFYDLWNDQAEVNTAAFARLFHPVPDDRVRTWDEYGDYYERFFRAANAKKEAQGAAPSTYRWGHVVAEDFPPGDEGVREVKAELARIRGTLVDMPLLFLDREDIAREGVGFNTFTEVVYT